MGLETKWFDCERMWTPNGLTNIMDKTKVLSCKRLWPPNGVTAQWRFGCTYLVCRASRAARTFPVAPCPVSPARIRATWSADAWRGARGSGRRCRNHHTWKTTGKHFSYTGSRLQIVWILRARGFYEWFFSLRKEHFWLTPSESEIW